MRQALFGVRLRDKEREWTPAVHALLKHLETVGFRKAPRALGIDGQEEVLSLLHGDPAFKPWPPCLQSTHGLEELGHWLRDYHHAVRDFRPPADARWQLPEDEWKPGMVIRHGDLGPWNSIWDGDSLTGFIDWDFRHPETLSTTWRSSPGTRCRCGRRIPNGIRASPASRCRVPVSRFSAPPTELSRRPCWTPWRGFRNARPNVSDAWASAESNRGPASWPGAMRRRCARKRTGFITTVVCCSAWPEVDPLPSFIGRSLRAPRGAPAGPGRAAVRPTVCGSAR